MVSIRASARDALSDRQLSITHGDNLSTSFGMIGPAAPNNKRYVYMYICIHIYYICIQIDIIYTRYTETPALRAHANRSYFRAEISLQSNV